MARHERGQQTVPGALVPWERCGHLVLQTTVVPGKQVKQFGHHPLPDLLGGPFVNLTSSSGRLAFLSQQKPHQRHL